MINETFLKEVRGLFERWGISADDWYLTGEAAMHVFGYPVTMRDGQMDVLLCREKWPWPRAEEQVSLFPDVGTKEEVQLNDLINRFSTHLDIHPLPHVGLSEKDRFEHTSFYPDETGVRVLLPWAGVLHRKLIIEFYEGGGHEHGLAVFDQKKFIRWKKFVEEVAAHARSVGDAKTIETAELVLPALERAIAFFDVGELHTATASEVRGMGAFPGVVSGTVVLWKEGIDPAGKVVVMEQAITANVTALRSALGIVTNQGGLLSHAATIAREYKIPTVVGAKTATEVFTNGDFVELDGLQGIVRKTASG